MKTPSVSRLAAFLPAIFVALIHFKLNVLVGPRANVIFQHGFDTGEPASGADAVIQSVNKILSLPIPALWFAKNPVYGLAPGWWAATILNSLLWGLATYACYALPIWLLAQRGKVGVQESTLW